MGPSHTRVGHPSYVQGAPQYTSSVASAASECGLLFRRELPLSREGASLVGRGDSGTDIAAALSGGEAGKEHTFTSFTYIPNLPYNTY